jgi:hypothetical protein
MWCVRTRSSAPRRLCRDGFCRDGALHQSLGVDPVITPAYHRVRNQVTMGHVAPSSLALRPISGVAMIGSSGSSAASLGRFANHAFSSASTPTIIFGIRRSAGIICCPSCWPISAAGTTSSLPSFSNAARCTARTAPRRWRQWARSNSSRHRGDERIGRLWSLPRRRGDHRTRRSDHRRPRARGAEGRAAALASSFEQIVR